MTEQTQITKSTYAQMVAWKDHSEVIKTYESMLGDNAGSYLASAVNLVRNDSKLQECTLKSLKGSMMTPAILKLSIEKTLGQCYIIPYGKIATFQIGYKGIIQLCIRSGQYQLIHCSEIYADELKSHNPITGQVDFNDSSTFKMRYSGNNKNVIGHYAYFKLNSGFEKGDYMSVQEAMAHGKKYSQAYQYDLAKGKRLSFWSTDPIAAGNKTVIKRLLSKFGIMSVEIQKAIAVDDSYEREEAAARQRVDAGQGSVEVETKFEPKPDLPDTESELTPQQKAAKTRAANKAKQAAAEQEQTPPAPASANATPLWHCKCEKGKKGFESPKKAGAKDNQFDICPHCFTGDHLVAPGEVS